MNNPESSNPSGQAETGSFVSRAVEDSSQPVTVFSLSWCGYCRALKSLFDQLGISYQLFDVDTPPYQKNNQYEEIRRDLRNLTSSSTLPQVFIGGEYIGGYSETHDAYKSGRLKTLLDNNGVSYSG